MRLEGFERLACPLDGLPLTADPAGWRCESGHRFDRARQGYAHLLPVQHKRSREPGDSKPMVAARARFLAAGFYQPIATALSEAALQAVAGRDSASCLDAGCGEGYYLRQLAAAAESAPSPTRLALLGVDISKAAVSAAARSDRRITWLVASNARLPLPAMTLDALICGFGFPVHAEFARVLAPGGRLLLLDPGPDHLRELREIIYPSLKPPHPRGLEVAAQAGFRELGAQALRYRIELETSEQIGDLLLMTPHSHRATAEGRARAAALDTLSLTVDVRLAVLERNAHEATRSG